MGQMIYTDNYSKLQERLKHILNNRNNKFNSGLYKVTFDVWVDQQTNMLIGWTKPLCLSFEPSNFPINLLNIPYPVNTWQKVANHIRLYGGGKYNLIVYNGKPRGFMLEKVTMLT